MACALSSTVAWLKLGPMALHDGFRDAVTFDTVILRGRIVQHASSLLALGLEQGTRCIARALPSASLA